MALDFNHYAEKGYEFLNLVAEELQMPQDKASRILQAVLHALRNCIGVPESLQVLAQLPMMIKAVYVDRWSMHKEANKITDLEEFIDEVRRQDGKLAAYDFGNNDDAIHAIKSVFRVLSLYLSDGEFKDIIAVMPDHLKKFVQASIERKSTL